MIKKLFLLLVMVFAGFFTYAQTAEEVYNQYVDFNAARFSGEQDKVLDLGESLLPNADKLPEKARINFYFSVGKMYEDNNQPLKAVPYYEKVAVAVPDYYVVHRALGYLYLADVKDIETKLNVSANDKDKVANTQLTIAYEKAVRKTLPQLEKAQACDPSDETLVIIKMLYKNIKDTKGVQTLEARLKEMSKSCIDLLSDK